MSFPVDCNATTVSQKLNALAKGGIKLELNKTAFLNTGRPRKLVRKNP